MASTMRFDRWEDSTGVLIAEAPAARGLSAQVAAVEASVGMTLVASTSFSAIANAAINNCFSTKYDFYKIIVSDFTFTDAGIVNLYVRYNTSAGDDGSTNYFCQYTRVYGNGTSANGGASSANIFTLGAKSTGAPGNLVMEIQNPAIAKVTTGVFQNHTYQSDIATYIAVQGGMTFAATNVFTGFTIGKSGTGTMSGNVKVYGYRNA